MSPIFACNLRFETGYRELDIDWHNSLISANDKFPTGLIQAVLVYLASLCCFGDDARYAGGGCASSVKNATYWRSGIRSSWGSNFAERLVQQRRSKSNYERPIVDGRT